MAELPYIKLHQIVTANNKITYIVISKTEDELPVFVQYNKKTQTCIGAWYNGIYQPNSDCYCIKLRNNKLIKIYI